MIMSISFARCRLLALLGGVVVSTAIFVTAGSVTAAEPKRGGTLVMTLHPEPPMLVSALTAALPTYVVSPKIIEGLVTYDFDFNLKPALATSWKVSADGKEIAFNLRRGVKWHDGKDFTASDVVFSVNVLKERHPRGRTTYANVTAIETPDSHTVVLKLSKPAPYMMNALAAPETPIIPEHIFGAGDITTNPANNAPVGTGPFKFVKWNKGDSIIVERNPDYWDKGKPYLDRIIFRTIPDSAARAVALETGEAHLGGSNPVPLPDVERLRSQDHLGIEKRGYSYQLNVARIEFNFENQYLKHYKVRQAIAHAIDKNFIVDNIWYGLGTPATGPIHKDHERYYTADGVPTYPYDPKKSERLLDEAGFKRGDDGVRFKLTHDYLPFGDTFKRTAEYLKQTLGKIGIEVEIRSQDFPSYIRRVYTERDFDFTNHWMVNTADPTLGVQRLYWSKNFKPGVPFSNGSGYSNPEVDRLLEGAQVATDPRKRAALFHEFQRKVVADLPAIDINSTEDFTIYNKKVKNHTISPLGIHESFADVFLAE